ncbi:MAG: hypothetical protein ACERKD_09185 [Prolixibacteraceae bacterium]
MRKIRVYLIATMILGFIACNEDVIKDNESIQKDNVLHFETVNEMNAELSALNEMSLSEKASWAASKGFTSYGVEAELFYDKMDPESLASEDEIIEFVNNSMYLEIRTDVENEKSVDIIDGDNPLRYFVNNEKYFIVGDQAVKIFGRNSVSTSVENMIALKELEDVSQVQDNPKFSIKERKTINLKSAAAINSADDLYAEKAVGNYRITMEMWADYGNPGSTTTVSTGCLIKAQKKTLFWFLYTTTIRYKIDQVVNYTKYNSSTTGGVILTDGWIKTTNKIDEEFTWTIDYYNQYNPGIYWGAYDNYAYFDDDDGQPRVDIN